MHESCGASYGLAEDWPFLDVDGAQASVGDNDENLERWLASITSEEFERTLEALFDDPMNRFLDRTA
jgi:hypothetical protein